MFISCSEQVLLCLFSSCVAPGRQMPLGTFCSRSRCPHGRQGLPTNSHPEHTTVSKASEAPLALGFGPDLYHRHPGIPKTGKADVTVTGQASSPAIRACRGPASTQFPSFQLQDLWFLAGLVGPYICLW